MQKTQMMMPNTAKKTNRVPSTSYRVAYLLEKKPQRSQTTTESLF